MKYVKSKRRSAGKVFVKCSVNAKAQNTEKSVRIGVLGASGYTGSEVYFSRNSQQIRFGFYLFVCLFGVWDAWNFSIRVIRIVGPKTTFAPELFSLAGPP